MNLSLNFLENLILITSSFSAKTPENSKGPQREMNHLPTAEWGEHVSCEECNYEKISWQVLSQTVPAVAAVMNSSEFA